MLDFQWHLSISIPGCFSTDKFLQLRLIIHCTQWTALECSSLNFEGEVSCCTFQYVSGLFFKVRVFWNVGNVNNSFHRMWQCEWFCTMEMKGIYKLNDKGDRFTMQQLVSLWVILKSINQFKNEKGNLANRNLLLWFPDVNYTFGWVTFPR